MAYYPLSQIKTNLQTDGTEYQYLDGTPYKGFYYKISTGKYYTGKSPQSGQPQEIVEIPSVKLNSIPQTKQIVAAFKSNDIDPTILPEFQETQNIYSDYVALTSVPTSIQNPYYNPTYPTDEDYTIGEFRRYFVKRANNIIYIEKVIINIFPISRSLLSKLFCFFKVATEILNFLAIAYNVSPFFTT